VSVKDIAAGCSNSARRPSARGSFRPEFGVEMLASRPHLARLERGDVLVREVLRPNRPAVPGAQALIFVVRKNDIARPAMLGDQHQLAERAVERFADPIREFAGAERDRRYDKSPFSPK
jgi:hypothetical protein